MHSRLNLHKTAQYRRIYLNLAYREGFEAYYDSSWDQMHDPGRDHRCVMAGLEAQKEWNRTHCAICFSPYHPSTGHMWTDTMRLCGPCTRNFIKWLKAREAQMSHCIKKQKTSFTEAALTSIKPEK